MNQQHEGYKAPYLLAAQHDNEDLPFSKDLFVSDACFFHRCSLAGGRRRATIRITQIELHLVIIRSRKC